MEPLPGRPLPTRPVAEVVRAWLQWFGLIRLLVVTIAICGVGAGAFWLLRAPATPIEDTLPIASRSTTSTTVVSAGPSSTLSATGPQLSVPLGVVVIDVAGAVQSPAVYELPAGSRVHDAIDAAGGLAADADSAALNLAAPLRDGDRLYVPRIGVPVPTVVLPTGGAATPTVGSSVPNGPIDLNRATADELDTLPGIGPATATAIVDFRDQIGPFASVDDLLKVHGIGPAKLEAIRALVSV